MSVKKVFFSRFIKKGTYPALQRYVMQQKEKKKENTRRVFDHLLPSADREARRRKDEWKAREGKGGGEESLVGSLGWDGNRPPWGNGRVKDRDGREDVWSGVDRMPALMQQTSANKTLSARAGKISVDKGARIYATQKSSSLIQPHWIQEVSRSNLLWDY